MPYYIENTFFLCVALLTNTAIRIEQKKTELKDNMVRLVGQIHYTQPEHLSSYPDVRLYSNDGHYYEVSKYVLAAISGTGKRLLPLLHGEDQSAITTELSVEQLEAAIQFMESGTFSGGSAEEHQLMAGILDYLEIDVSTRHLVQDPGGQESTESSAQLAHENEESSEFLGFNAMTKKAKRASQVPDVMETPRARWKKAHSKDVVQGGDDRRPADIVLEMIDIGSTGTEASEVEDINEDLESGKENEEDTLPAFTDPDSLFCKKFGLLHQVKVSISRLHIRTCFQRPNSNTTNKVPTTRKRKMAAVDHRETNRRKAMKLESEEDFPAALFDVHESAAVAHHQINDGQPSNGDNDDDTSPSEEDFDEPPLEQHSEADEEIGEENDDAGGIDSPADSPGGNNKESLTCTVCGKECASGSLLKRHENGHKQKDLECSFELCNYITYSMKNMSRHIQRHHHLVKPKKIFCPYCNVEKRTLSSIEEHVRLFHQTTHPFHCHDCETKPFHFLWEIDHHRLEHHTRVSCKQCGTNHDNQIKLKMHMKAEHPDCPDDQSSSSSSEGSGPVYDCSSCEKVF